MLPLAKQDPKSSWLPVRNLLIAGTQSRCCQPTPQPTGLGWALRPARSRPCRDPGTRSPATCRLPCSRCARRPACYRARHFGESGAWGALRPPPESSGREREGSRPLFPAASTGLTASAAGRRVGRGAAACQPGCARDSPLRAAALPPWRSGQPRGPGGSLSPLGAGAGLGGSPLSPAWIPPRAAFRAEPCALTRCSCAASPTLWNPSIRSFAGCPGVPAPPGETPLRAPGAPVPPLPLLDRARLRGGAAPEERWRLRAFPGMLRATPALPSRRPG